MSKEVRWMIQVSKPGLDDWLTRDDLTYTGWFYGDGSEGPTEALLTDYREAVATYHWLDLRLVRERRSIESSVINLVRRSEDEQAIDVR